MTIVRLLFACMEKGVKLSAGKKGRIRANPRSEVSGAMKQAIAEHKPALLELLRGGDVDAWRMIRIKPKVDDVPEPAGGDYVVDDYEPDVDLAERQWMEEREEMERERESVAHSGRDELRPFVPPSPDDDDDGEQYVPF